MSADIKPHGTTLTALKGLAIASTFLTAGQLGTVTSLLPSLYPAAQTSHRLAAQQFAHQHRYIQGTSLVAEGVTSAICGGLAYLGFLEDRAARGWKLWAAAAGCLLAIRPWTMVFMEAPSTRLLWVSEVASSASTSKPSSTGIAVKVTEASPPGTVTAAPSGATLGLPGSGKGGGAKGGAITPMEEFEPFEDAVMDEKGYEQLKVIKLLKRWNGFNGVRAMFPFAAGVLGLWASLSE